MKSTLRNRPRNTEKKHILVGFYLWFLLSGPKYTPTLLPTKPLKNLAFNSKKKNHLEGFLSCEPGDLWISFLKITSYTRQNLAWLMNQFQFELVAHNILSSLCQFWNDVISEQPLGAIIHIRRSSAKIISHLIYLSPVNTILLLFCYINMK